MNDSSFEQPQPHSLDFQGELPTILLSAASFGSGLTYASKRPSIMKKQWQIRT
jgi:hypothetical protein